MKYTHLFGAAALAVAMGTQGLALTTTNIVYSQDFDGVDTSTYTLMSDLALTGWSDPTGWSNPTPPAAADDVDKSFLVAAPVSASATEGYEGYTGKHLELNTDGHELVYTPTSGVITNTTAQISMRVRLVGSESDPTGLDTDVHSAVYLKTDENDPTFAALYAYTWSAEGQTNEWVELDTTGLAGLANGAVLALRVTMDYANQRATYEGVIVTDAPDADIADSAYVGLGTINMANVQTASVSGKVLSSVAFRGTGGVDNLVIRDFTVTASEANITFEVFEDEIVEGEEPNQTGSGIIDTIANIPFSSAVDFDDAFSGKVVKSITLYEKGSTGNTELTLSSPIVIDPDLGNFEVGMANYQFEAEKDYLLQIVVGEKTHTVTFDLNGHGTAIPAQTVKDGETATAPEAPTAEGWTFGGWTLSGASYNFATPVTGDITLVATWTEVVVATHTVTFDLNGHGTAIPAQTVNHNGTATEPTAPTAEGWTFGGWTLNGASYDFATLVTGDITLVATWTEASSDLDEFSIGDDLPAGVDPITVDGDKFIVNVVVPQGATASLLGSSTVNGVYAPVTATVTAKDGYTELVYTMGANETAKFFKVKFSK